MAETSYPFSNQDTSEAQFSQWATRFADSGVDGQPSGTELKVTGDSSGMQVKVAVGAAGVRGFAYDNSSIITKAIAAAAATLRKDLIVLRLDPSTDSALVTVLAGTAGSGVYPAITQTATGIFDVVLGGVDIAPGTVTITAAMVTDLRRFMDLPFGLHTTATRPTTAKIGKPAFNVTTGKFEYWNGTVWGPIFSDAADLTQGTITRPVNADLVSGLVAGKKFTVNPTAPSSPAVGDVWIQYTP